MPAILLEQPSSFNLRLAPWPQPPSLCASPSWLKRFLLDLGLSDQELNPNKALEVVLPGAGKKK